MRRALLRLDVPVFESPMPKIFPKAFELSYASKRKFYPARMQAPIRYRHTECWTDRWINEVLYPGTRPGTRFFVEAGAVDGVRNSACYVLERLGWKGICVEGNRRMIAALRRNRPGSLVFNVALAGVTGEVTFKVSENFWLSGIDTSLEHRERGGPHDWRNYPVVEEYTIPSLTLGDLLRKAAAPDVIDVVTMDIEQSEVPVLGNFDFQGPYAVRAFVLEGWDCTELLHRNGYASVRNPFNEKPWEQYYVHRDFLKEYPRDLVA